MQTELTVTCVIQCESPERLRAVEQLVREKIALDSILTSVARAFPGGVEKYIIRQYRLGDLFEDVRIVGDQEIGSSSFRLLFHPRRGADVFWKDAMVKIITEIKDAGGVSIGPVTRVQA